ncbi:sigma-54-dependent Fis family transcriptional regulator [candidate division TA06 bacterium]|uniref:Sigma-54-dependent Fis family transcriptional regulator n=1 Tax=candidate division TA06 bacterium TaxID=2250710 RepID=A0A523XIE5_UNCT6|nr:MAG: sigma-54-dependent Fis family transcriptional regulator [candidate division TA06 bacterium]
MGSARVLIVDDEEDVRDALRDGLTPYGHKVETAADGPEALEKIRNSQYDIAIIDLKMPKMDGIELLRSIRSIDDSIEAVMLTAFATVSSAVSALKLGAFDYLTKPTRMEEINHVITNIMEKRSLKEENTFLKKRLDEQKEFGVLVSISPKMREINEIIHRISANDSPIFIEGESGTGKELVARAIHFNSKRAQKAFIPVNCGAIPHHLLESELFGHKKGSFTGAISDNVGLFRAADSGTLFLDEIGEMPGFLQVKLLRVLQDQEIRPVGSTQTIPTDVRLIAATNADVDEALAQKALRKDLYYRLSVVHIKIPPLRERKGDIPILVHHFIKIFNEKYNRRVKSVAPACMETFAYYDWPGNVRELENVVERAFALNCDEVLMPQNLPSKLLQRRSNTRLSKPGAMPTIGEMERQLIEQALNECGGNKGRAADMLGVGRKTIYRKIKKYGISA